MAEVDMEREVHGDKQDRRAAGRGEAIMLV